MRSHRMVLLAAIITSALGCGRQSSLPLSPVHPEALRSGRASVSSTTDLPPTVQILHPAPSHLIWAFLPLGGTIQWTGDDPDGRIVAYKYLVIPKSDPDFDVFLGHPDSLLRRDAPFSSWPSLAPHITSLSPELDPNQVDPQYLIAITAIDNDGNYDPVFSLDRNVLWVKPINPGIFGPVLTATDGDFSWEFPTGTLQDPLGRRTVDLSVHAGDPITIHWSARAPVLRQLVGYRWGLDLIDLDRDGPRAGSATPPRRWTSWALDRTSATVGPFGSGETHLLYIEARDDVGFTTLGIVRLMVS